jgi:proline racemase
MISTVDYHTAGEPFRIVSDGVPKVAGATVRERREHALSDSEVQRLRRLLCNEPRGHANMYGGLIVPPDDDAGDLGVLFWHREGFSTACGHGTIALGAWAVQYGHVRAAPDGETELAIDVPSGRVKARVRCKDGEPQSVVFGNVPTYILERGVELSAGGVGVRLDVAFAGAIYACLPAGVLGLEVRPDDLGAMVAAAREIKHELREHPVARHPVDERLSGIYGVMFNGPLEERRGERAQRTVTIFADGEVDRSPCGSGTSARLALLNDDGALAFGQELLHESIVDTLFTARITGEAEADGRRAVLTEVEGMAYRTGEHRFILDPRDPVGTGFLLA